MLIKCLNTVLYRVFQGWLSKIAGHENVKITLERYSQYIPVQNMNFGNCFKKIQTPLDTELAPKENIIY